MFDAESSPVMLVVRPLRSPIVHREHFSSLRAAMPSLVMLPHEDKVTVQELPSGRPIVTRTFDARATGASRHKYTIRPELKATVVSMLNETLTAAREALNGLEPSQAGQG